MPEQPAQHWTESLFDSVYALYETAREYQAAYQSARLTRDGVDFDRRKIHEGRIEVAGPDVWGTPGMTGRREPHANAVAVLDRLYGVLLSEIEERYDQAALIYASGAAWAVRAVQRGEQPAHVTLVADRDVLVPPSLEIPGLDTWSDGPDLDAAYNAVVRCTDAAEYVEALGDQDYISDQADGELLRAHAVASGMADASFTYGLQAQRALNFVLLEPRRAREREIALARAEARRTESTAPGDAQA
ncbi:hypothetical protein [Streptomyces cyaneofuscatus]|uniref:hypothetical protein n=1 Tax=Streptomyces cyaneofuscatus TaxID=66883 RepID=UPI003805BFF3